MISSSKATRVFLDALAYPYPGRSTKVHSEFIIKWLMSRVFPGVPETFAKEGREVIMFMSEDFPTFERPIKAYSGIDNNGHCSIFSLLHLNSADFIIMVESSFIDVQR